MTILGARPTRRTKQRGLALLLVVSLLTIVAVITVSFVFAMRLETAAATNFRAATQAQYIAEAGINYAKALLRVDAQTTTVDDLTEPWSVLTGGTDVDSNDDGTPDARWYSLAVPAAPVEGRYAVLIQDEAGKLNLNAAGLPNRSPLARSTGWSPAELNVEATFREAGLANAHDVAVELLQFRYGPDGQPGVAGVDDNSNRTVLASDGIDNDGDGIVDEPDEGVDEPDEFVAAQPYGDDHPLAALEEMRSVRGFDEATVRRLRDVVTIYSADRNVTQRGQPRLHLPTATPEELMQVCLEAGVANPWQQVVNIVDAMDDDLAMSRLTRIALRLSVPAGAPQGAWRWQGNAYVNDQPGSAAAAWTWSSIPNGDYILVVYGASTGSLIGDVTIETLTQRNAEHGDTFSATPDQRVHITNGTLRVFVQHRGAAGTTASFSGVELIPTQATSGLQQVPVRGIEAVRMNEVMVKPVMTLATRADQSPGGDWAWSGTGHLNQTAKGGTVGQGQWTWTGLPSGNYYLIVHTGGLATMVGDVSVNGLVQPHMRDGERFTRAETVTVSGGTLRLAIQNNEEAGACALVSIELSQQPDAEYVELVNLSDRAINIGGWSVNGPGITGWPAIIPLGTMLEPHRFIALAVDQRDAAPGLSGNGISLSDSWGNVPSVQLQFTRSVTPRDDLFKDNPTPGTDMIVLQDEASRVVDAVEYAAGEVPSYVALEKGDPTVVRDANQNGMDDGWYPSTSPGGGTPGAPNRNAGMIERVGLQEIEHTIEEITMDNHAPASVAQLGHVPSGEPWRTISLADIAKLADRLTINGHRLECDGHVVQAGGWQPLLRSAPLTTWFENRSYGDVGIWRWSSADRLMNGTYLLKLYGQEQEALSCSWRLADGTWTEWTPSLQPDINGRVVVGQVEVGMGTARSTPARTLELRVRNDSSSGIAHLNWVSLTPQWLRPGVVNINTASRAVLMALPGMTASMADRLIAGRPYGNRDGKRRGIGDLLLSDALGASDQQRLEAFEPLANLITVRSNHFQLIATGQVLEHGRSVAEKRIRTVIER